MRSFNITKLFVVEFRGFNDAVNCFSEDGWTSMNAVADALDNVNMFIKRTDNIRVYANSDTVICVKASLLLHVSF